MSYFGDVQAFHEAIGLVAPDGIVKLNPQRQHLRLRLLLEEHRELHRAITANDPVSVAKEVADLVVVALGAAAEYGIPFDGVWPLVHESNMAKRGGSVRDDGKVLKPEGWQAPNLASVVCE